MKPIGIVRQIDELGRIVLPKELRMKLNINERDYLEVFVDDGGRVVLKKYEPACVFCGSVDNVTTFEDHSICCKCLKRIAEQQSKVKCAQ